MRGLLFVDFLEHVEQQHGLDVVDTIIEKLDGALSTGGAYTAVGNYPHGELLALATALCTATGTDAPGLLRDFARRIMNTFQRMHPGYFEKPEDLFEFLLSVESLIHVDVRKLYPDANPPLVQGRLVDEDTMLLRYDSHRPLAELALALVEASADVFEQRLDIDVIERSDDDRSIALRLRKLP